MWTRSRTGLVSRAVRLAAGLDAGSSPCTSAGATPRSRERAHVRMCRGWVGRAGLPGAFWCASPFFWPFSLPAVFAPPPPGWVCPASFASFSFPASGLFYRVPPLASAFLCFRPRVPWALALCGWPFPCFAVSSSSPLVLATALGVAHGPVSHRVVPCCVWCCALLRCAGVLALCPAVWCCAALGCALFLCRVFVLPPAVGRCPCCGAVSRVLLFRRVVLCVVCGVVSPYNVCPSLDSFGPLSVASNRHISLQPPSARGSTLLVILLTMLCMVMNHSQLVHPPTDGPRTSRQSAFRLVTPVSPGCSQSVWSRSVTQMH